MTEDLSKTAPAHTAAPAIRYFRAGGFNQLHLETAEDLKALATLDQTLWVASSCPTTGLDMDETTLKLMDTDGDGRIRVPEIISVVGWVLDVLKDPASLPEGRDWLDLEQINQGSPAGLKVYEACKRILRNLGRFEETRITLADAMNRSGIFAVTKSNGDGVIPASAADGPAVAQVITDILNTVGGATDRGGDDGITADGVKRFYAALSDYTQWWTSGHPAAKNLLLSEEEQQADLPELDPTIFPLGDQTAAASAAVEAVAAKVEDYFENCEVAAFDAQVVSFFNFSERDLGQLGGRTKAEVDEMLQKLPLARVQADAPLPLSEGVNPYYASALNSLNQAAVSAVFGEPKSALTRAEWQQLRSTFAAYRTWLAAKKGGDVEKLGLPRIGELQRDNKRAALEVLIQLDQAIADEILAVDEVEKLLRYHRDLFRLLNNYVALPEFYDTDREAIFQMGRLVIDGCALNLCVMVDDMNRHSLIAEKSGIFLAYCEITRKGEPAKKTIAAAVTQRGVGRITVGKNAVFYDRYGRDWDARVVKVVSNPISLREAAVAPFKKFAAIISTQVEKLSAAREKAIESSLTTGIQNVSSGDSSKPSGANVATILAGGGVALAALTSSFAYIVRTLQSAHLLSIVYTIGVILLFIIVPALISGYFKLRARDIGMILEAGGWAINGRMRITLKVAKQLMHVGHFSRAARRTFPSYAEKRGGMWRFLLILLLLAGLTYGGIWAAKSRWGGKNVDDSPPTLDEAVDLVQDAVGSAVDSIGDKKE